MKIHVDLRPGHHVGRYLRSLCTKEFADSLREMLSISVGAQISNAVKARLTPPAENP